MTMSSSGYVRALRGDPPLSVRARAPHLTVVSEPSGVRSDLTPPEQKHVTGCDGVEEHYCRRCGVLSCACGNCDCWCPRCGNHVDDCGGCP